MFSQLSFKNNVKEATLEEPLIRPNKQTFALAAGLVLSDKRQTLNLDLSLTVRMTRW